MVKQEAQDEWDAIVTVAALDRAEAERIVGEQVWFSYTPSGCQVFSSGGSSGVRGVYVWVLGAIRDAGVFGLADAGARPTLPRRPRRPRGAARPDASRRARGWRAAPREYPTVRRRNRSPDADRGHHSGCSVRASAQRGGRRRADSSRRLRIGDRA